MSSDVGVAVMSGRWTWSRFGKFCAALSVEGGVETAAGSLGRWGANRGRLAGGGDVRTAAEWAGTSGADRR